MRITILIFFLNNQYIKLKGTSTCKIFIKLTLSLDIQDMVVQYRKKCVLIYSMKNI